MSTTRWISAGVMVMVAAAWAPSLSAQADEIQVYDGGLAAPGVFNITLHNNFTARGIATPAFDGAVVPDGSLNGVPEWAYGVNDWLEVGLYLPLYSADSDHGFGVNGVKLRTLFAVPNAADRFFFYGLGIEYSFNAKHWDPEFFTSEIRPIIGWHFRPVDLIFNPILGTAYDSFGNMEFSPSARLAYNASDTWAFAVEEYADFGPLNGLYGSSDQAHQLFGVVDYVGSAMEVQFGVGFGLTDSADALNFKLILSKDLN